MLIADLKLKQKSFLAFFLKNSFQSRIAKNNRQKTYSRQAQWRLHMQIYLMWHLHICLRVKIFANAECSHYINRTAIIDIGNYILSLFIPRQIVKFSPTAGGQNSSTGGGLYSTAKLKMCTTYDVNLANMATKNVPTKRTKNRQF